MTSLLICLQDKNEYFLLGVSCTLNTSNFCAGVGGAGLVWGRRLGEGSYRIWSRQEYGLNESNAILLTRVSRNEITGWQSILKTIVSHWKSEKQLKDISRYHSKITAFPYLGHSGVQIPYSFESSLRTKASKKEVAVVLLPFLLSSLLLRSSREP